jgi:hypothetical protein
MPLGNRPNLVIFGCIAVLIAAMSIVTNTISAGPRRAGAAIAPTTAPSTHALVYTSDSD